MDFVLTTHAREMLKQRNILEEWVLRTVFNPDWENIGQDDNTHYFKEIIEFENRVLHVIMNPNVRPKKVVTVFFDRKARRQR
ncbi:DUF4258 domain-containing protein [bacterium]|nr:DUF4258 domain-containing protein [bacterium]